MDAGRMVAGVRIVPHSLARDVRREFSVALVSPRKRRKRWRVVETVIDRPSCFVIGNTFFMHPDLVAAISARAA